jgi:hypothetical protein
VLEYLTLGLHVTADNRCTLQLAPTIGERFSQELIDVTHHASGRREPMNTLADAFNSEPCHAPDCVYVEFIPGLSGLTELCL